MVVTSQDNYYQLHKKSNQYNFIKFLRSFTFVFFKEYFLKFISLKNIILGLYENLCNTFPNYGLHLLFSLHFIIKPYKLAILRNFIG